MAGGGTRCSRIFQQITSWKIDIVTLSEFRNTPASKELANLLYNAGFIYQQEGFTDSEHALSPAKNRVFLASKYKFTAIKKAISGVEHPKEAGRWLLAKFHSPIDITLGVMHIPNQVTGRKGQYHQAVLAQCKRLSNKPAIFIGDTNSGKIGIDEENPIFNQATDKWFDDLSSLGWQDAFRMLHGDKREYTWYSPNKKNGFRLDQALLSPVMCKQVVDFQHQWGTHQTGKSGKLSDHAAILLDINIA